MMKIAQSCKIVLMPLLFIVVMSSCGSSSGNHETATTDANNYLYSFWDEESHQQGYKNTKGEIVIPTTRYDMCFTDTFKTYAIVAKPKTGLVAIDRNEKILYQVFNFDNGPDEATDGLFRMIKNNKIGYAAISTGKIVIEPIFDCAFPFENGRAKVSKKCTSELDGEYTLWKSENWYYIDKNGKEVEQK